MTKLPLVTVLLLAFVQSAGAQPFSTAVVGSSSPPADPALTIPAKIVSERCDPNTRRSGPGPFGHFLTNLVAPFKSAEAAPVGPTAEEIARAISGTASPAESAAAKIKVDEAGAKARKAAVHFLGTVDCHYYPEAEAALIAGLRADRSEAVRLEAAVALGNGCCCTKKTIEALHLVVTGSEQDGNPAERSDTVKIAALAAFHKCAARGAQRRDIDTAPRLPSITSVSSGVQRTGFVEGNFAERTFAETFAASAPPSHRATGLRGFCQLWFTSTTDDNSPSARNTSASRLSGLSPIGVVPRD